MLTTVRSRRYECMEPISIISGKALKGDGLRNRERLYQSYAKVLSHNFGVAVCKRESERERCYLPKKHTAITHKTVD